MCSNIKILISVKHQVLKKPLHSEVITHDFGLHICFFQSFPVHSQILPAVCRRLSELMLLQFTKPLVLHNFAGWKKLELDLFWHTQCNHSDMSCPAVHSLKSHCISIIVGFHLGKIVLPQCDFHGLYFKQNYLCYSYKIYIIMRASRVKVNSVASSCSFAF